MFNISQFLSKIRNVQAKGVVERNIIAEVLKNKVGLVVPIQNVGLKSFTITIKGLSPSAKSLIYIKKQSILDEINRNQPNVIAKDIK